MIELILANVLWIHIGLGVFGFMFVHYSIRNGLSFIHLLGDRTRLGVLEFSDPVAHSQLEQLGELHKVFQLPVVATKFLLNTLGLFIVVWIDLTLILLKI